MNIKTITVYMGYLLALLGLCMVPAIGISIYNGEIESIRAFVFVAAALLIIGLILMRVKRERGIQPREGFIIVALGWVLISLFGALPFFISGAIPNFADALFETVSGFSTTGATILSDIESLSRGMLYWRSFTHWIGGMGVLVLVLALSSLSKGSGEAFFMMRAESPGPTVGKLTPTLRDTARILYFFYIALTALQIVLLLCGGMPLFDSVTNAFATAGTGGFCIKNASIGAYNSVYIEMVTLAFMLLFGVNFGLYYLAVLRQFGLIIRNTELRIYIAMVVAFMLLIALDIMPLYDGNFFRALRYSGFHVVSIMTTTGFAIADFNVWPQLARYSLLLLMIIGACAGSTAGGLKISRVVILYKSLKSHLQRMLRPRALRPVRMDDKTVPDDVVSGVHAYIAAYIFIVVVAMLLISLDNSSLETTVTSVITCISNAGPGLDLVGPTGNFGFFTAFSKVVFSFIMLLGRLEIFPLLLLFMPATWRRQA
ncbi:MAG: TrkH family potassium uptake protein [Clostridiales bacterium]|jgi:trk system potassium uptake protein TrkH|nr:TrkH family potassium uptake protein [Clostridiales bacterium]